VNVGLDATYSLGRALSGVGVYCRRLFEEIAAAAPKFHFILYYRPHRFFRSLLEQRWPSNVSRRLLEEPLNVFLPRRVAVFHGLNQRLPRYCFRQAITTFHDLFALTGEYSTPEFRQRFAALARDAAARSGLVIAVSCYTAHCVEALLGVESSRIVVIHHGVDPIPEFAAEDLKAFRRRFRLERPFLLHVGALQARKNILRLIEAFETLEGDFDLVLAGSDGYKAEEIHACIANSPARQRIRALGYLPNGAIERLYRSAAALAFPSLEEGFGLPVLEAMSAGLPVVTSNCSALAEIAGGAALLVDPLDTAALAEGLSRATADSSLRRELIEKGRARAAQFTWRRAAERTRDTYRQFCGCE
jgi:glycosyltransferase involved in cell wall biosynthesis